MVRNTGHTSKYYLISKIILSYLLITFNSYVFAVESRDTNILKIGILAPFSGEFKSLGETILYSANLVGETPLIFKY